MSEIKFEEILDTSHLFSPYDLLVYYLYLKDHTNVQKEKDMYEKEIKRLLEMIGL